MLSFSETFQTPLKPREDAIVRKGQGEGSRNPPCTKCNILSTSPEESDSGATENDSSRGPKPRKIRKLGWERTKLRNLKAWIDESHNESLSDKQRRTSAHVTRTGDLRFLSS